jgi:hypothetical protein
VIRPKLALGHLRRAAAAAIETSKPDCPQRRPASVVKCLAGNLSLGVMQHLIGNLGLQFRGWSMAKPERPERAGLRNA